MSRHKIICGHVIPVLKTLPDEHVDMLMTSVPYWGLRNYGEDTATIWGGNTGCEHEWDIEKTEFGNMGGGENNRKEVWDAKTRNGLSNNAFCSKCGAWYGQLGLEPTPELYIEHLRMVFAEVKRVLKKTGTCWVNIGDTYGGIGHSDWKINNPDWIPEGGWGSKKDRMVDIPDFNLKKGGTKPKCMCMIPERFAFMMLDLGYLLRNKIIWHKPNPMPSSVKDRFNTTYEILYFFSKNRKYWFDLDAVRCKPTGRTDAITSFGKYNKQGADYKLDAIKGKNPGDFWSINTQPFPEAHFAVFPEKLCEKPILAGCPAEVCMHCGMARVRITEKEATLEKGRNVIGLRPKTIQGGGDGTTLHHDIMIQTIGWTDCPCLDENKYQPGIVMDPFGGGGTVSVEAEKLGRSSIYIDIKRDYCEMAIKRLKQLAEQTDLSGKLSSIEKIGF